MGDTIKDQLDELEKSADNFANEIVNTFKEMEESDKEFQKSFDSILTSVSCYNIGIAIQKEIKYLLRYEKTTWLFKWYYKKRYRKARYNRIKIERFFKYNANYDRSNNR